MLLHVAIVPWIVVDNDDPRSPAAVYRLSIFAVRQSIAQTVFPSRKDGGEEKGVSSYSV